MNCLRRRSAGLWLLSLLGAVSGGEEVAAHEVRPGYLEIVEISPGSYSGRLRQPILAAEGLLRGLDLKVVFPTGCERPSESRYERSDGYLTERFEVVCPSNADGGSGSQAGTGGSEPQGLADGGEISIAGLRRSITDIYATFEPLSGDVRSVLLNAANPGFRPLESGRALASLSYLRVGVEHLFGGIDHVLFVLGLLLLATSALRLLLEITAFTVALSLTLGLAALGIVRVPSAPVEAGIALSVLFLAFELTRGEGDRDSLARRRPEVVAFAFGLLHGLGFAGVLGQIGLPQEALIPALFAFNVGVEIGQVAVVALFGGVLWLLQRRSPRWAGRYRSTAVWVLGIASAYFFFGTFSALL